MIRLARALLPLLVTLSVGCAPIIPNPNGYCDSDGDCAAGARCIEGRCAAPLDAGGDCTASNQCPGGSCCSSVQHRCVASTPAWSDITPKIAGPSGRYQHTAVWDEAGDRMLVLGGRTDGRDYNSNSPELWSLPLGEGGEWEPIDSQPAPVARTSAAGATDLTGKRALFVGGYLGQGRYASDLPQLALEGKKPSWSAPKVDGTLPSALTLSSLTTDPARGRMILIGGVDQNGVVVADPVWELTLSPLTWRPLSPTGEPFITRAAHSAIYDPTANEIVVYGGDGGHVLGDTWGLRLDSDPPSWHQYKTTATPPQSGNGHSAVFDSANRRMIVFGGQHYEGGMGLARGNRVASMQLRGAAGLGDWSSLVPDGTPPTGRDRHSAIYDARRERMVIFGGATAGTDTVPTALASDVWALSLPACM